MSPARQAIVRAWIRRLLPPGRPHVFGPEHVAVVVVDVVPRSERRFRMCLACGRSEAAAAGTRCRRFR